MDQTERRWVEEALELTRELERLCRAEPQEPEVGGLGLMDHLAMIRQALQEAIQEPPRDSPPF